MSILSKEAILRLLGPQPTSTPVVPQKPKRKNRFKVIPQELADIIRKEHWSYTNLELAKKHGLSESAVWNIRRKTNSQKKR